MVKYKLSIKGHKDIIFKTKEKAIKKGIAIVNKPKDQGKASSFTIQEVHKR